MGGGWSGTSAQFVLSLYLHFSSLSIFFDDIVHEV